VPRRHVRFGRVVCVPVGREGGNAYIWNLSKTRTGRRDTTSRCDSYPTPFLPPAINRANCARTRQARADSRRALAELRPSLSFSHRWTRYYGFLAEWGSRLMTHELMPNGGITYLSSYKQCAATLLASIASISRACVNINRSIKSAIIIMIFNFRYVDAIVEIILNGGIDSNYVFLIAQCVFFIC